MLIQQVNLYRFLSNRRKITISFEVLAVLYGLFVLWLLINFSCALVEKHHRFKQLNHLNDELVIEKKKLIELMLKYPFLDPKDLEGSLHQLQQKSELNARIFDLLTPGDVFSDYLRAIADAAVSGLWLTDILISKGGDAITLKGRATQILPVQSFLNRLSRQAIFSGKTFDLQELTKLEADSAGNKYLSFYIVTKVPT